MPRRFRIEFLVLAGMSFGVMSWATIAWSDDAPAAKSSDKRLTTEEAKKLKSPVPFNKASVARGKILYTRDCTECHGADGKSLVDVVANATDLTDPKAWKSGTTEGEVYRSIRDGAGEAMPPFNDKFPKEDDLWHVTNFLRSLWPDSARPKLQD
jgi:mono/diheme cytochrome c family protein